MAKKGGPGLTRREVLLGGTVALAWTAVGVAVLGGDGQESEDRNSDESGTESVDQPENGTSTSDDGDDSDRATSDQADAPGTPTG